MSSHNTTSIQALSRLIGTPDCPAIVDVRIEEDYSLDMRLIPSSIRRSHKNVDEWALAFTGRTVVVSCQRGEKLSHGTAAWLRHCGVDTSSLEGGFEAWRAAGELLVRTDLLPPRDSMGRTRWVTRERPKVDRIACPWLIRRFVDPTAIFLFVEPSQVALVADRFEAAPFDVEGVFWSHRAERCTFDTMIEEFGLRSEAMDRLATIVRGADTARPDLAPQASGLLAASLGLSRLFANDLKQLDAGITLYDSFYLWCRDAAQETHNWPAPPRTQEATA
ncbi:chromate resistance protein ChrB domain-containing protein [Microvirga puerhi]|uniref:Sulfurtransferase/chromate resistance protein n=1 Tax=Microvirga puerhi TaxID=2876078 RepID=A0ABS7VSZ4_9HYPH|nr:sulfurtransferase/chromate resistance protein [Microvirga puerhi]MBZ6078659.1 sulfurtransferase/chromate resistance protein [Microvirga puerhi]